MNRNEVVSIGKVWLWVGVFSTCLFAGCGETVPPPKETVKAEPQVQTIPAHDEEDVIVSNDQEYKEEPVWMIPEPQEEYSDPDVDQPDIEEFNEEEDRPDVVEEDLGQEPLEEKAEILTKNDVPESESEEGPEVALNTTTDSSDADEFENSESDTLSQSQEADDTNEPPVNFETFFEAQGDSDDFAEDSSDEFEDE